jgi:beta-glucosidase
LGHWGYIRPDEEYPEGHYQPISLQYKPYTAEHARAQSIGAGDPTETATDRSYKGFTETTFNIGDMQLVLDTKAQMGDKPVVVIVAADRPFVPSEIEPASDAILLNFGVSNNALLDVVSGKYEPSGLLPMQLPANMKTVETQCEDVPFDMECYKDMDGNVYDFAFGLNWDGVIMDHRVDTYRP